MWAALSGGRRGLRQCGEGNRALPGSTGAPGASRSSEAIWRVMGRAGASEGRPSPGTHGDAAEGYTETGCGFSAGGGALGTLGVEIAWTT